MMLLPLFRESLPGQKKRKKKKGHWHKRLPETNTQKILIQEVIIIKIAI